MRTPIQLLLLIVALASPAWSQATTLFASDINTSTTGNLDRDTAAWRTFGPQVNALSVTGLGWDDAGRVLYGVSPNDDRIYSINAQTGRATPIGAVGTLMPYQNVNALAYDSNNNKLYAADLDSNSLLTINVATGAPTLVGVFQGTQAIEGLAYDRINGVLYGLSDAGTERIYVINPNTAAATPLPKALGVSGVWRGLSYDVERKVLYGTTVDGGRTTTTLYLIDPDTGEAFQVGVVNQRIVQGIAIDARPSPTPLLTVRDLVAGGTARWRACPVGFGSPVVFLVSTTGGGPTTVKGLTLGLTPPILEIGRANGDGTGLAELSISVPLKARGRLVWTQAIELSATKILTNPLVVQVN